MPGGRGIGQGLVSNPVFVGCGSLALNSCSGMLHCSGWVPIRSLRCQWELPPATGTNRFRQASEETSVRFGYDCNWPRPSKPVLDEFLEWQREYRQGGTVVHTLLASCEETVSAPCNDVALTTKQVPSAWWTFYWDFRQPGFLGQGGCI